MAAEPAAAFRRSAGAEDRSQPRGHRGRRAGRRPRRLFPSSFIEAGECAGALSPRNTSIRTISDARGLARAGDGPPLPSALADLGRWRGIARLALTKEGTPRKTAQQERWHSRRTTRIGKTLRDDWFARLVARSTASSWPRSNHHRRVARSAAFPRSARGALDALARLLLLAGRAAHAACSTCTANAITPRSPAPRVRALDRRQQPDAAGRTHRHAAHAHPRR